MNGMLKTYFKVSIGLGNSTDRSLIPNSTVSHDFSVTGWMLVTVVGDPQRHQHIMSPTPVTNTDVTIYFRLTNTEKEQVQLNSIRQMFTYLSSIIVFLLAGVIIKTKEDGNNELTWDDCWSMQSLCYIISAIGLVTTIVFQIFTPEKASSTNMLESTMVATIRLVQVMPVES